MYMLLEEPEIYNKNEETPRHPLVKNFKDQLLYILENLSYNDLEWLPTKLDSKFSEFLESVRKNFSQYKSNKNKNLNTEWLEQNEKKDYNPYLLFDSYYDLINRFNQLINQLNQFLFFDSFCDLLNRIEPKFLWINNNISATTLHEYNNFTIWKKLFHNGYIRGLWHNRLCEWWNHNYWTLLFYNIFNELKNAWLDIDIKIFRFKKHNTRIMGMDMGWYSWLIVKFHEDYYVIDSWRLSRLDVEFGGWIIVKSVDNLIGSLKKEQFSRRVLESDESILNKLRHPEEENSQISFFNNSYDFLKNINEQQETPHISLCIDENGNLNKKHWNEVRFTFTTDWIIIEKGSNTYEYTLNDIELDENNFIDSFVKNCKIIRRTYWDDEYCIKFLKKHLDIIKDMINLKKLCEYYSQQKTEKALCQSVKHLHHTI